jgi:hydrogenase nickel incorporation protein HypA/HybF
MHELAVCQDIIAQVEQLASEHNAKSIYSITLDIGPLSGVESALLEAAFPIASAGTVAENALLEITVIPVTVSCNICHQQSSAAPNKLICAECGSWQTRLVSGDEMLLKRVELDTE